MFFRLSSLVKILVLYQASLSFSGGLADGGRGVKRAGRGGEVGRVERELGPWGERDEAAYDEMKGVTLLLILPAI